MANPATPEVPQERKLLDRIRDTVRLRHYSLKTEQAYAYWARCFVRFHGLRHPREMGAEEVKGFLTHLAVERNVAAATQNQAKAAIQARSRRVRQTRRHSN